MDDKPDYDVFNFDDLGFVTSLLMSFLLVMLLLFHLIWSLLTDSFKYAFLGPNESLPIIIASDLDQDQDQEIKFLYLGRIKRP